MKKAITIAVIILVVLGFGFYLFKISDNTQQGTGADSGSIYNDSINTSNVQPITSLPPFNPNTDHYQGSASAKNVFIEYADYQCPACAEAAPMLKQAMAQLPDTVFVFRYFPLVQIHPNSVEAALAAEAAGTQGKYWEMHDLLFQNQSSWEGLADPLDAFAQYAQQAGVKDISQFKSDVTGKKNLAPIQTGYDQAMGLNLEGTPTYFFNGHQLQNSDLSGLLQEAQPFVNK